MGTVLLCSQEHNRTVPIVFTQALALIDRVIRKFSAEFVEDFHKRLAENRWDRIKKSPEQ